MTTQDDPPQRLAPGDRVGSFVIQGELGAGGMGVVYVALQEGLDRRVALKVISPRLARDPDFRARFVTEAHAQGALDSPHVVHVYDHGEDDGHLYLATQLVPDGDLSRALRTTGPLSMHSAVDVLAQVADGLQTAHRAGLVHRDIKPANVLLRRTPDGLHAYLTDFGVVGVAGEDASGQIVGTPAYQAPELADGSPATPGTDVYALGCLLWAALMGRAPYAGADEVEMVRAHATQPLPTLPPGTPLREEVDAVLARALAKRPDQRYASAAELRQALLRLLPRAPRVPVATAAASSATRRPRAASMATHTPRPTPTPLSQPAPQPAPQPTPQPTPQHTGGGHLRRWLLVAAVVVLVVVAGGVALWLRQDSQRAKPPDPAIARAVTAIDQSFTEGDAGEYYPRGYGRCVGEQTVEATGVQALVDDGYLDADVTEAQAPGDVDSMSEGVATAWADAQVQCQDWDATNTLLKGDDYPFGDDDVDAYTTCMRELDPDEQRTALRKQATGDTGDSDVTSYRVDIVLCTAKLL